jgi:predicted transcriptional regulator
MDLTAWLEFFTGGLATQLDAVKARGQLVIRRDILAREHGLNPRQASAVELLLEKGELRIDDVEAAFPGVHRRTLQRDLQGLVEGGLVKTDGAARAMRYLLRRKK